MIKGLDGRDNERLPHFLDVCSIPHFSIPPPTHRAWVLGFGFFAKANYMILLPKGDSSNYVPKIAIVGRFENKKNPVVIEDGDDAMKLSGV